MSMSENIKAKFNGGILTGEQIRKSIDNGDISISSYDSRRINPNSYNLTMANKILVYKNSVTTTKPSYTCAYEKDAIVGVDKATGQVLYMRPCQEYHLTMEEENETVELEFDESGLVLLPNMLYIGATNEKTATTKYVPMLDGRSSGGRLGMSVHICAGFGDIGFEGTWTLEITVVHPLLVFPNKEICQICYYTPYGDVEDLYRGRYHKQEDPTASRFHEPKQGVKNSLE